MLDHRDRTMACKAAALGLVLLLSPCSHALAQGSGSGNGGIAGSASDDLPNLPIPSSVNEVYSPIGFGFESPIDPREGLPGVRPRSKPPPSPQQPPAWNEGEDWAEAMRRYLDSQGPFVRDTELYASSRSYWLSRQSIDGSHPEALTTGGSVSYQSGYAGDFVQLRGVVYTTQPLYAPQGEGSTLNLTPDGDQITTLGQINARFKLAGQDISVGRQLVRTAFLNPEDTRMIPLTFEGVMLVPERKQDQGLDYIVSYLDRYKPRDSAEFISFSDPFGISREEGMLINGVRYRSERINVGLLNYWIKDTLDTVYGEADYLLPFGGGNAPSYRVGLNDLDQCSTGEDLIPGGRFNTNQASLRLVTSYAGFVATMAGSSTGKQANIRDPFGNIPVYTAMHQSSFERAGENAYLTSLSYDFSELGLQGLKFLAGWGQGFDAIDAATGMAEPARNIWEVYLDYEPDAGPFDGFQVQLYYSDERLVGAETPRDHQRQLRAVVNYLLPML